MSVLIENMGMPKTCFDCIACVSGWCEATDRSLKYETITRGKPKWCPLVEVPTADVIDKIRAEIDQYLLQNEFGSEYRKEVSQIIEKYRQKVR